MTPDSESEEDIADAAAMWLEALKAADAETRERFGEWLLHSARHVRVFLEMAATEQDVARVRRAGLIDAERRFARDLEEAQSEGGAGGA